MGSIFLTAVYPTATTGAHENNGGKSAGKDVFPSGKERKCMEKPSNPVFEHPHFFSFNTEMNDLSFIRPIKYRQLTVGDLLVFHIH